MQTKLYDHIKACAQKQRNRAKAALAATVKYWQYRNLGMTHVAAKRLASIKS